MSSLVIAVIIVLILMCVVLSAFYSGSEIVFNKVNKLRLERNAKRNKKARLAYNLNQDYPKLIGTILVGNNLVNILASSLATLLFTYYFPTDGALISTIVMTVVILIFGEILPKTLLQTRAFDTVKRVAGTLSFFEFLFAPIVWPVNKLVNVITKWATPKEVAPTATDDELLTMVDEIEESGFIDEDTADLTKSAIDFLDTMAYEVITPRVDLYTLDIEDDLNEEIKKEEFYRYSRVIVYKDTIDNIVGVINTNMVLKSYIKNGSVNINDFLYKPIYVHKTKLISDVLQEFKEKQIHIAIVIDEFGGTLGILTMEDILEELVGDIWDELDTKEVEYRELNDRVSYADGDMNIDDLFKEIEFEDDEFDCEYSTVAGWCTEMLEKFPTVGDKFQYKNLTITILQVSGVRVEKVKVEIGEEKDE